MLQRYELQPGIEGAWEVFFLPKIALRSLKTARGSERWNRLEQVSLLFTD